jgi:hypothetical protein
VDTEGKGVEKMTAKGIQCNGKEHPVDTIIMSTGFVSPGLGTAAGKAGITVTGKNGQQLEERNNIGQLVW